jgi:peptidoglycan L-alanyl-D-glutamate endopeptidase CwlK
MKFDKRSEDNLATLLPAAQGHARQFLQAVLDAGIHAKVISGTRTFKQQDALFAKGRTKPGPKVTNARGGFSNHNYGVAWDIGIFDAAGNYLPESPLYRKAGQIGRGLGLEWGGDWQTFPDQPHFQCHTGLTLAQMRALVLDGRGDEIPVLPLHKAESFPLMTTPEIVEVFLKGKLMEDVKAQLIDSRVWVAVRSFVEDLGGAIVSAGGDPFQATVELHGHQLSLAGRIIHNNGYVKFADLNELLGFSFVFDSKKKRLTLSL